MKEDSKKLLKNYLYEIKVKRIQNIFDTFYFSSDFKEMIERKLIQPYIDTKKEAKSEQAEKKDNKFDSLVHNEFSESLMELSELKRRIKNRQIEEQIEEDKKILGFKISNANETEKNVFLTGKEKEAIESELRKIKVKGNSKEKSLLQDQYNVGIIKYDYDDILSSELPNEQPTVKDNNVLIKANEAVSELVKANFPSIGNIETYDYKDNPNLFLLNFEGNKYSLYYPFHKVVLNEDDINNENKDISDNYFEIDSGSIELQLNKRAFILKEVNNIDDDLEDIINKILDFLCGFYYFNQINEFTKSNKTQSQETKNKNFKKNGTFISAFIDTNKFIESKFDEKEMKLIKEKFELKEKIKAKKNTNKKRSFVNADYNVSKKSYSFKPSTEI